MWNLWKRRTTRRIDDHANPASNNRNNNTSRRRRRWQDQFQWKGRVTHPLLALKPQGGRKSNSLWDRDTAFFCSGGGGVFMSHSNLSTRDQTSVASTQSENDSTTRDDSTSPPPPVPLAWQRSGNRTQLQRLNRKSAYLWQNHSEEDDITVPEMFEDRADRFQRPANLPRVGKYSNNHLLVNIDRTLSSLPTVMRSRELDCIARVHAEQMALQGRVYHVDLETLREALQHRTIRRLGENVRSGESVMMIHLTMLSTRSEKCNILNPDYTNMGMGTARGRDGEIYLCQIFLG